jgi:hypothetical protein
MPSSEEDPAMSLHQRLAALIVACTGTVLTLASAAGETGLLIGTPDTSPTLVLPDGGLKTAWGTVRLCLAGDTAGAAATAVRQARAESAILEAVTESAAGGVRLILRAYRAPVFPAGFDVLEAEVANTTTQRAQAAVGLQLPEGTVADASLVRQGGRPVVAIAPPPPVLRGTGCITPAEAMPGWGHPNVPCHNAFRNIRAGMGGIPIAYQFLLNQKGDRRTVVLGLCESHWAEAGKRPLILQVEGAAERRVDPVAEWGQHRPGCVLFAAGDTDGDARIDVRVLPVPDAPDRNTILNAIWLFPAEAAPDLAEVLAGRLDSKALCVVDVGGPGDGPLTEPGKIDLAGGRPTYRLELEPGARQTLGFLVAVGGSAVPAWSATTWTLAGLRQAASDVWAGGLARAEKALASVGPGADECRAAVGEILVSRTQADDFYLALGEPGASVKDGFTFAGAARVVQALDRLGLHREAERLLRVHWDKPVPEPLAACGQREDGRWEDPTGRHGPHAQALLALARHALATDDGRWLPRTYPAIRAGAEWLRTQHTAGAISQADAPTCARALATAAEAAVLAGHPGDATWMRQEAEALGGTGATEATAAYTGLGRCVDAANRILALTAPQ